MGVYYRGSGFPYAAKVFCFTPQSATIFLLQTPIFAKLQFNFEPFKNILLKILTIDSYLN